MGFLLKGYTKGAVVFNLLSRDLDEPRKEGSVVDKRLPLTLVPVHVLQRGLGGARLSAQQNYNTVSFSWDKSEQEDVPTPTVVALQDGLTKGPVHMEGYLG